MFKSVVIMSGGMDSTTLLYQRVHIFGASKVSALTFDYGQKHRREIEYAKATCDRLDVKHHVVDLRSVNQLIDTSALTSNDIDVPEGHYADETMKITVVPNRNAMMLNVAIAHAVSVNAEEVCIGIHAGDHAVYPDCRPDFIYKMQQLSHIANEGFINPGFKIIAPFVFMTKAQIATEGHVLDVPWKATWSCYRGGARHCGRCSTCLERIEAFSVAGIDDPTEYEDLRLYEELVEQGKLS